MERKPEDKPIAAFRLVLGGGLVLALALPLVTNEYQQFVINLAVVYIPVCLGFNLLLGYLGQLAFANAAFFGVGAYVTGIAMGKFGLAFVPALLLSALFGAFFGALVGLPALRGIRRFYLAILTMAAGELLRWTYIHADGLTNGSTGLEVPVAEILGFSFQSEISKYYLFLAIIIPLIWMTSNLLRSRVGRAIVAIRESEQAATALAIHTSGYFVLTFALSGLLVGVGGSLFALSIGRVVPESFSLIQLIQQFSMVMLGGLGSISGSIIGAVVVVAIPEISRGFPGAEELIFSFILMGTILFLPGGLASLRSKLFNKANGTLYRGTQG